MKPIQVEFKPSVIFIGLFLSASFTAGLIVVFMPILWQLKGLMLAMIALFSSHTILYRGLLRLSASIVRLSVNVNHELSLLHKDGSSMRADITSDTTVTPHLVVINYLPNANVKQKWRRVFKKSIIILPDSATAENLRELRVWLRWHKQ